MEKYTTKITLRDKTLKNRMSFLEDVIKLEKEKKIDIKRNVYRINGVDAYVSEMEKDALFSVIKDLSNKYESIYVTIENNLFNDCTVYKFNTGRMVEREYYKHFA